MPSDKIDKKYKNFTIPYIRFIKDAIASGGPPFPGRLNQLELNCYLGSAAP
ncbi:MULTISPECIES: hypothetical protein [Kamptonema]|uniref:hypothetical protein n=1 Tax=Kamptonema TaxID=1501433 RepID=UPI0001DAD5CA|nr:MULTISPECIES: hypothetical protein [Kamptonema]CBN54756.1 hypothetical protein OSCI_1060024 [Kamptonema sp. PCC 6506]